MKWHGGNSSDCCGCHKYYLVKRVGKTSTSYILECSSYHKQHSLLSDTIFQNHKILLGNFLFFNENKGINDNITGDTVFKDVICTGDDEEDLDDWDDEDDDDFWADDEDEDEEVED